MRRVRAGEIVQDRFEIVSRAGAGGMGVVYRALDRLTQAPVALILSPLLTKNPANL